MPTIFLLSVRRRGTCLYRGAFCQDGRHLGLGLHCTAVQIVADPRADDRAGAKDDLAAEERDSDASIPAQSGVGDMRGKE